MKKIVVSLVVVVMFGSQVLSAAQIAGSNFETQVSQGVQTSVHAAKAKTAAFGKKSASARLSSCAQNDCVGGRLAGAPSLEEAKAFFNAARMPSFEEMVGNWGMVAIISKENADYNMGDFLLSGGGPLAYELIFKSVPEVLTGEKSLGVLQMANNCSVDKPDCARGSGYVEASRDLSKNVLCFKYTQAMSCRINESKGLLICKSQGGKFLILKKIPRRGDYHPNN